MHVAIDRGDNFFARNKSAAFEYVLITNFVFLAVNDVPTDLDLLRWLK
jgi:hypothetical protein